MASMKAAVIRAPGGPDVIKIENIAIPTPKPGQVLIRVRAFGLNRSELFTRHGLSPNVAFPRVLGIEAVGTVEEAPGGEFRPGEVVATAMGGMGRDFDGGYAEFTCVSATQVQTIATPVPWKVLGAVPEMLQTAWGSLFKALQLKAGDQLLVRGGTTSVGLAATAIAKSRGARVASTTRRPDREALLRAGGADEVIIDTGDISAETRSRLNGGADKVLELVGTTTLRDSLRCTRENAVVCMTGMVGSKWTLENFSPMEAIPTAVYLTTYDGGPRDFMDTPLDDLIAKIVGGILPVHVGQTFLLDDIVEAHRCMEENRAGGKIVVVTRAEDL